jgi:ribosome-binding factor A
VARPFPRSRAMGEMVREVVARILVEEIADPRLDLVTVTGVEMSPDLRHANVFFAIHGDAERTASALAGLDSAKGRIRALLGVEVRARYVPELHFRIDPAIEEAARIADAIKHERDAGRVSDEVDDAPEDGSDA